MTRSCVGGLHLYTICVHNTMTVLIHVSYTVYIILCKRSRPQSSMDTTRYNPGHKRIWVGFFFFLVWAFFVSGKFPPGFFNAIRVTFRKGYKDLLQRFGMTYRGKIHPVRCSCVSRYLRQRSLPVWWAPFFAGAVLIYRFLVST